MTLRRLLDAKLAMERKSCFLRCKNQVAKQRGMSEISGLNAGQTVMSESQVRIWDV